MSDIKTIVQGIGRLKPISKSVHQVMALAQQPEPDMLAVVEAIARDPILTANVLKQANSSFYGRPGRFETVRQAVVFLGITEVFDLVLMAGCKESLARDQAGYDLQAGELWRNSLCSALLAKAAAAKMGTADTQLVFTAAMLKDIGKVVLSQYVSAEYEKIRELVDAGGHSFYEAEKAVLGIDHAALGAMVAQVWQFSPKMVAMIRHHHRPLACEAAREQAAAVYMGDLLCMMAGIGVGADGLAYRFQRQVVDWLGVSETDMQQLLVDFDTQRERLEGLLDAPPPSGT